MSSVSEWVVREYFEALGFLVQQPVKYQVAARRKRAEEEIDLLVMNPLGGDHALPSKILWKSPDLRNVTRAVVSVRGWHTDKFSPKTLELSPEVFRFAEDAAMRKASGVLGEGPVARILCLPDLTSTESLRKRTLEMLRGNGIDGVLLFRTMLLELVAHVETQKSYEKSDLLQILRLMKNYDLIKDPQMDLFASKRRKRKA
ncbi:MAG TPA: hypothetical protein PKM67_01895 [Kiritimatiellia bacterium]|nr:hypothetical protein [Kiritimatiellia bacterium]HNR93464.1 hypothetical protein [Kiritimatiellia bacterium]HNS80195.1 hypothetical protein [Kiritimatiellia bacterium]HPA78961.1 hypothetical protein [Kiritimatiellia bacterium]HQQ05139.1 hypothetical protein [Kiritimatiellia bacterium]